MARSLPVGAFCTFLLTLSCLWYLIPDYALLRQAELDGSAFQTDLMAIASAAHSACAKHCDPELYDHLKGEWAPPCAVWDRARNWQTGAVAIQLRSTLRQRTLSQILWYWGWIVSYLQPPSWTSRKLTSLQIPVLAAFVFLFPEDTSSSSHRAGQSNVTCSTLREGRVSHTSLGDPTARSQMLPTLADVLASNPHSSAE